MATPLPPSPVLPPPPPAVAAHPTSSFTSDPSPDPFATPSVSRSATFSRFSIADSNAPDGAEGDAGGEAEADAQALGPVDGGKGAWFFVVAAFVLETFIWGYSYSFATILVYFESHDPWQKSSLASLSAVGTTQLGIQFILPLFITLLYRRYPEWVKPALWTSVGVSCGSMLLSSWATQVWQLILLQGVLCGVSGAALYTPVFLWMSEWWVEKRGLASGIIFAGTGMGGFCFPFLINALLTSRPSSDTSPSSSGFSWMCRAWALITLLMFSLSVWLIGPRVPPPRRQGKVGRTLRRWVKGERAQGGEVARGRGRERGPWLAGAGELGTLKNPIFGMMCLASLLSSLSTLPVSLNIGIYSSSLAPSSLPHIQRELAISLFNLAASLGCAVTGYLSDYSYAHATTVCGLMGAVLSLSAWGLADTLPKTWGFAVVFGFFSQQVAAWSSSARDVAGSNPHTASLIFCLFSVVRGVASIVMPFVSEVLYNRGERETSANWGAYGFGKMIIFVGVTAFLSSLGGLALHVLRLKQQRRHQRLRAGEGKVRAGAGA
ncbi:hypothetical protein JCM6882_000454 [Rhodosporidiobolus microsporus]